MLHSIGLAACPTLLPRAVTSTSPRPKLPALTHPLLLAGLKVPKRHRLCRPNGHPLGLTALQTKYPPVGPESCWGSAVSDACPCRAVTCRLQIRSKAKASSPIHPLLLAGSKVPKSPLLLAGLKVPKRHRLCRPNGHPLGLTALQTKYPPVGPESCWGSAASECPRRAVTCRLRIRSKAKASSPIHPLLLAGSKVPKSPLLLASSKVPKRHRLCRPNGHPLGLNPAGVVLFRMRADAGPLHAVCGLGPRPKLPAPPILCF